MNDLQNILGQDQTIIINNITGGNTQVVTENFPVGTVAMWYQNTAPPSSWLLLNGSTFDQTIYPDLYTFLGNTNTLPDFRDKFLRGKSDARSVGSSQASSTKPHVHGYSGFTLQGGDHQHTNPTQTLSYPLNVTTASGGSHNHNTTQQTLGVYGSGTTATAGSHSHTISYDNGTGGANVRAYESSDGGQDGTYPTSTAGDHSHTFDINAAVTIPDLYTTTHSGHTHTISQTISIPIPQTTVSASGTHSHQIGGTTDVNDGTDTIPPNIAIQYMIKAKVSINGNADPVQVISADRLTSPDQTKTLLQTNTEIQVSTVLNMVNQRISNVGFCAAPKDAVSLEYLNTESVRLEGVMDSKDNAVKALYQAADSGLQSQITTNASNIATLQGNITTIGTTTTSLQNQITTTNANVTTNTANIATIQSQIGSIQGDRIVDTSGNYLQVYNGEVFISGITNFNCSSAVIQGSTNGALANSLVNVNHLASDFKSYIKSSDSGAGLDQAGFQTANEFNVVINNNNKMRIQSTQATMNVPFTSALEYQGITSFTSPQQLVNKYYVDNYPQYSNRFAKFQAFSYSSWGYTTHNLFGNGNAYILKPQNNCFTTDFNINCPIELLNSGGYQYLRCTQSGYYDFSVSCNVLVGVEQSAILFSTWLNQFLFGRHLQNGIPSNSAEPHRYNSMVMCLVDNSSQYLAKDTKSIFELTSALLQVQSGSNYIGASYDRPMVSFKFSQIVFLIASRNYFIQAPVVFGQAENSSELISSVYDCDVSVKFLASG